MQILPSLSNVFKSKPGIARRFMHRSLRKASGESPDRLERILYGMAIHEQGVVMRLISMAGETVPVQNDTMGIRKNNTPCYLYEGTQIRISDSPLLIDHQGEVRINVFDENNKPLSLRLSDYILDIDANSQELENR
jgi:hypothetical protein